MSFQPGITSNPRGRPKGSVNRRTQEVLDLIKERGDTDPLVVLSDIASNSTNPDHRISASNTLAPYLHSKRGMSQAPRFVEDAITVPEFTNIQEAENFLAEISRRAGAGELELQSALDISTLDKNWIISVRSGDEFTLKLQAQAGGHDTTIRIEGGLPSLPGTNVIMDDTAVAINGHNGSAINGHGSGPVIEHSDAPALTESAQSEGQEP
jgi:hypothetical protein